MNLSAAFLMTEVKQVQKLKTLTQSINLSYYIIADEYLTLFSMNAIY